MIVTCSQCQTRFKIADAKVKAEGIKVRCSKCKTVFQVYPAEAEAVPPAAVPVPSLEAPAATPPELASAPPPETAAPSPPAAEENSPPGVEFSLTDIPLSEAPASSPFDAVVPSVPFSPAETEPAPPAPPTAEEEAPREMFPELMPREKFAPSPVADDPGTAAPVPDQIGGTIDLETVRREESSLHLEQSTPGWSPAVAAPSPPPAAAKAPRPAPPPRRRETAEKLPVPEFSVSTELPPPTNRWITAVLPLLGWVLLPFFCAWLYLVSLGLPFGWRTLFYSLDRQIARTAQGPLLVQYAFSRVDYQGGQPLLSVAGRVYNPTAKSFAGLTFSFRALGVKGELLTASRGELDPAGAGEPVLLPGEDRSFYFFFPWPGAELQRMQVQADVGHASPSPRL